MPHRLTEVQRYKIRGVRERAKELEVELEQKAAQLKQLQEEREELTAKHTILVSVCDSLYFLRATHSWPPKETLQDGQPQTIMQTSSAQQGQYSQDRMVSIDELLLLQQLAGIEYSGPHLRSANLPFLDLSASAYAAGQHQPISPDEDPFLLSRFVSTQKAHLDALKWELPDVLQYCSTSVPQLAMALAKLEAGLADEDTEPEESSDDGASTCGDCPVSASDGSGESDSNAAAPVAGWVKRAGMAEHPLQTIQRIQIEWLRVMATLLADCKAMMVMKLPTVNFDTGETEKAPSKRRHMFAVRGLGLTQHQLRRLKVGFAVFQRLQGQVADQQRQLQEQGVVPSSGSSNSLAAGADDDFSSSNGARLEAEQAAAAALNMCLHKKRILSLMQFFFVIGTLSWMQFAKLRVLMSPFFQFGPMLQACILEYAAEMEQQQQQRVRGKNRSGRKPAQQLVLGEEPEGEIRNGSGHGGSGHGVNSSWAGSNIPSGPFNVLANS